MKAASARNSMMVLAFVVLAAASVRLAGGQDLLLRDPVPVDATGERSIFPESWLAEPISAQAEPVAEGDRERARRVIERAVAKYPPRVLETHLDTVYVVGNLRYSGIGAGGTNSRRNVYVRVGAEEDGYTETYIERTFHAELSSILLRNFRKTFDEAAWRSANEPGFEYLGGGVKAVKAGLVGEATDDELHERGFLRRYGQSDVENDFNGFATSLFMGDGEARRLSGRFPRIEMKYQLTLRLLREVDPRMDAAFFHRLER